MNEYDFVILGSGTAGFSAAQQADKIGLKTALIGDNVGLCILRGCMPSKALIASSNRARQIRQAKKLGIRAEFSPSMKEIIARKNALIHNDFEAYRKQQIQNADFDYIQGRGHFIDEQTVEVNGEKIAGKTFLIATGSVLKKVEISGLEEDDYLSSDDVINSTKLPSSVAVLGGGAIGLEMGCYYEGLGSEITIINRNEHVLSIFDKDLSVSLEDALKKRGVKILNNTQLLRVKKGFLEKEVDVESPSGKQSIKAREILYALGRIPNLSGLDLAKAGVKVSDGKLQSINKYQQTNREHIFAAGDACSCPMQQVHSASEEGGRAARNAVHLLQGEPLEKLDKLSLFVIFSFPEVASAGMTEKIAQKQSINYQVWQYPFSEHGYSELIGETDGFVKAIVDSNSKKILGAAGVGYAMSILIHEMVMAINAGKTIDEVINVMPHYHPTLSEIWTYLEKRDT